MSALLLAIISVQFGVRGSAPGIEKKAVSQDCWLRNTSPRRYTQQNCTVAMTSTMTSGSENTVT